MSDWLNVPLMDIFPTKEVQDSWAAAANAPRELPKFKKGSAMYTMPRAYPWDLPVRNAQVCGKGIGCFYVDPVPVETAPLLTGHIGTLTGMTIHTDVYIPNYKPVSKYVYQLVHERNKVRVYVWERMPDAEIKDTTTYWYEYRSAREARVDMKRYKIGRRTWTF